MPIKHTFTSTAPQGSDAAKIRTSNWNDNHTVTFGEMWETGDFKLRMRTAATAGWVAADGGTIGAIGSGASYSGDDARALFDAWWAEYSDAQLPILTNAGGASTRGASSAADWAAGKRLTVFDVRDRVPRAAGTTQVNGTKLEATQVFDNFGNASAIVVPTTSFATNNGDGSGVVTSAFQTGSVASTNASTPLAAQKVRVASIGMLGCFKL